MATLAEAFVRLRPDTSTLGPEIERGLVPAASAAGKKAGEEAGRGLLGGLKTVAAGVAGFAAFDFVKGSVDAAREAAQSLRLTAAVITSTGGAAGLSAEDVHGLAEKLGELDGVQGDVIQSGANVLLTFTNIRNQSGAGNDIFDQATQSALDLSAAMHQDLQSSVVQLGKALNDPVKGVTALQRVGVTFTAQQKEQIKTLVAHNDTLGAQKIVLGELQKEFGGAGAAAADPAQKAAVAWKDFQEQIGAQLLPAISSLLGVLMSFLPTVAAIVNAVGNFTSHHKTLAAALAGTAVAVWLVNAAMEANPVVQVITVIGALVVAIVYCWQHFETFRDIVRGAWHDILVSSAAVRDFFTVDIPRAFDTATSWIRRRFEDTVQYVKSIPARIVGEFIHIGDDFLHVGEAIVQGIIRGVGNLAGELVDKVKNLAGEALDGVKNFLGIGSPSRVFADEVGRQIPAGIAVGVREHTDLAVSSVGLLSAGITSVPVPIGPVAQPAGHGDLLGAMHRVGDLLAALKLTVGPEGVALAARAGEKTLIYAGR